MSLRADTQTARSARRNARRQWRRDLLERAAQGETRQSLAEKEEVSLATVRRALARARAECPLESMQSFLAAQRDRLERAAALAESRIAQGDLTAAYALIQLTPLLADVYEKQRELADE